jgi:hypothetical protein
METVPLRSALNASDFYYLPVEEPRKGRRKLDEFQAIAYR